jgi:hypothetical protein
MHNAHMPSDDQQQARLTADLPGFEKEIKQTSSVVGLLIALPG